MDANEFLVLTPLNLQKMTGIVASSWCRYFAGRNMHTTTLTSVCEKLDMDPKEFLAALEKRREIKKSEKMFNRRW